LPLTISSQKFECHSDSVLVRNNQERSRCVSAILVQSRRNTREKSGFSEGNCIEATTFSLWKWTF
jgi:hypothetical protein